MMVPTQSNQAEYAALLGNERGRSRFYSQIVRRVFRKHEANWNNRMTVHVIRGDAPNSVVIVGPDGVFFTESNIPFGGKVVIDPARPRDPSDESFLIRVDMHRHAERYLNIARPMEG